MKKSGKEDTEDRCQDDVSTKDPSTDSSAGSLEGEDRDQLAKMTSLEAKRTKLPTDLRWVGGRPEYAGGPHVEAGGDNYGGWNTTVSAEQKEYWQSQPGAKEAVGGEVQPDSDVRHPEQFEILGSVDKARMSNQIKDAGTPDPETTIKYLNAELKNRVVLLDGDMSKRLEQENLSEKDYRGSSFKDAPVDQKGNDALLVLSKPDLVFDIHKEFLTAGSDICCTLTLDASAISLGKYRMQDRAYDINKAAAQVAKKAAAAVTAADPEKSRLVAGVLGPTTCALSVGGSNGAENVSRHASSRKYTSYLGRSHAPECKQYGTSTDRFGAVAPDGPLKGQYFSSRAWREWNMSPMAQWPEDGVIENVSFDEMVEAYIEQICGLVDGGVDMIIMKRHFDTLNVKAAVYALEVYYEQFKKSRLPLIISSQIEVASGRMALGQNIEAFVISMKHGKPLAFGMDSLSEGREARPAYDALTSVAPGWCSLCLPASNVKPDPVGYAADCWRFITEPGNAGINFLGGGNGVLPSHISELAKKMKDVSGRKLSTKDKVLQLSGTDPYTVTDKLTLVGQRGNLRGCEEFRELVYACMFNSAVQVMADQVKHGADILDINMDSSWQEFDSDSAMCTFLSWCGMDPTVAKVPVQIGSSLWPNVLNALKHVQGKPIVSAIGLTLSEEKFLLAAAQARRLGAALIIRVLDKDSPGETHDDKVRIGKRSYTLLRSKLDFPAEDIIFDCNLQVLGAEGSKASRAADFISAMGELKRSCPKASFIGGVSNLSLQFRHAPFLRQALHSAFLKLAIPKGLNMAICSPGELPRWPELEPETARLCEELILNTSSRGDHVERFSALASSISGIDVPVPQDTSETQIVPSAPLPAPMAEGRQPIQKIDLVVQSAGAITFNVWIVVGTKAGSCHHMHKFNQASDVGRTVNFSSISVWMGMGGSAVGPMASGLLDTYALWNNWQMMDCKGCTVQWGPIGDIGVRRAAYGSRDVFAQYDMGQKLVSAEDSAMCERALCCGNPLDFLAVAYVDDATKVLWEGKVMVKLRDQMCEMSFKISATAPLIKLEDVYLKQKNQKGLDIQLTYRGKAISDTDTAKSLNLQPADIIDVVEF